MKFWNGWQTAPDGGKFQVCIFMDSQKYKDSKNIYTLYFPAVGEEKNFDNFMVKQSSP